jgi:M6 family metalloprotease-like protein
MIRTRTTAAVVLVAAVLGTAAARDKPEVAPPPRPAVDLTGYRTVKDAVRADPKQFNAAPAAAASAAGYLGVLVEDKGGTPVVEAVEPESPAELAGLRAGDVVRKIDAGSYTSAAAVRDALRSRLAGDKLTLTVDRSGKPVEVAVTLKAATRPMSAGGTGRAILGVTLGGRGAGGGVKISEVTPNGPAAKAGVKVGDLVVKLDGKDVDGDAGFRELIGDKRPGDRVDLLVERDGKRVEARAVLAAEEQGRGGRRAGGGWDDRIPTAWRRPTYRLAILGIEYPDVKHNPKIADADWEASMFSTGTYAGKSATGEAVHGSMNDYYRELSHGTFHVEGKFLGWVEAKKKRLEYTTGSGTDTKEKTGLLTEGLDLYVAKHGKEALKDYDGIFFLYAGGRVQTTRGGLYWPHRANVTHNGKRWPYFIVQEGGARMNDISVFCHEFGHMLGLPDLYARPELPGSEGVGVWCAMSNQAPNGRPQHFCAWSKEQLGWVKPAVLDPRVRQKLVLAPIEDDPTQCVKVMVRADGSEYFLLENRAKTGFDAALPAGGLLVWRVVNNRPILEESHGVEGSTGPRVLLGSVPFPSAANTAFTPYTTPSSKSQLGGGLPVYVTNIRKLPDGRITFHLGYEYQ